MNDTEAVTAPLYEPTMVKPLQLSHTLRALGLRDGNTRALYLPVDKNGVALAHVDGFAELPPFGPLASRRGTDAPTLANAAVLPPADGAEPFLYIPVRVVQNHQSAALIDLCRGGLVAWAQTPAEAQRQPWVAAILIFLLLAAGLLGSMNVLLVATLLLSSVLSFVLGVQIPLGPLFLGVGTIFSLYVVRRSEALFGDAGAVSPIDTAHALLPWRQPRDRRVEPLLATISWLTVLPTLLLPVQLSLMASQGTLTKAITLQSCGQVVLTMGCLLLWRSAQRRPELVGNAAPRVSQESIVTWVRTAITFLAPGTCAALVLTTAYVYGLANEVSDHLRIEIPPSGLAIPLILQLIAAVAVFKGSMPSKMRIAVALSLVLGVVVKAAFGDVGGGLFTVVSLGIATASIRGGAVVATTLETGFFAAAGRIVGTLVGGVLFGVLGASIGEPLGEQLGLLRAGSRDQPGDDR